MIWVVIVIAIIIVLGITSFAAKHNTHKTSVEAAHDVWMSGKNINVDVEHKYNNPLLVSVRYIVDLNAKLIYIMSGRNDKIKAIHELRESSPNITLKDAKDIIDKGDFYSLNLGDINGFEILEDDAVVGGIGRAIAGGILAGGMGAIVGATTAKNHVLSYAIAIYTKDIANPQVTITLLNSKTKKDSLEYRLASSFAQEINASVKAIIANQEDKN